MDDHDANMLWFAPRYKSMSIMLGTCILSYIGCLLISHSLLETSNYRCNTTIMRWLCHWINFLHTSTNILIFVKSMWYCFAEQSKFMHDTPKGYADKNIDNLGYCSGMLAFPLPVLLAKKFSWKVRQSFDALSAKTCQFFNMRSLRYITGQKM